MARERLDLSATLLHEEQHAHRESDRERRDTQGGDRGVKHEPPLLGKAGLVRARGLKQQADQEHQRRDRRHDEDRGADP
jgi:hypothetical protein